MIASVGTQLALLAFAAAIFAGMSAGNSASTVLLRALLAMAAGRVLGEVAAWVARAVVGEHVRRRKQQIDADHLRQSASTPDGAA